LRGKVKTTNKEKNNNKKTSIQTAMNPYITTTTTKTTTKPNVNQQKPKARNQRDYQTKTVTTVLVITSIRITKVTSIIKPIELDKREGIVK